MKAHLDCIPCFQKQALQATRFVTDDEKVQEKILRKVITELMKLNWKKTPPELAHVVHGIVKQLTGKADPYKSVKKKYNDIALNLYPELKDLVKNSDDPLFVAAKLAIAGNVIDFGAKSDFNLKKTIKEVLNKDLKINDFAKFVEILGRCESISYILDNTGEIVFDKLLLETILEKYDIKKINFAVKGAPIINDATQEDAEYVGLDKCPKVEFIKVNVGIPNSGLERWSQDFIKKIRETDLIISKGQGNYESLSEQNDIFFLLMAKCPVIANDLGVEIGDTILKKT
ncbi:MAG: damage-control phosphatase ARMT1 family protein [Candidatus Helarchaeota archaeon]